MFPFEIEWMAQKRRLLVASRVGKRGGDQVSDVKYLQKGCLFCDHESSAVFLSCQFVNKDYVSEYA